MSSNSTSEGPKDIITSRTECVYVNLEELILVTLGKYLGALCIGASSFVENSCCVCFQGCCSPLKSEHLIDLNLGLLIKNIRWHRKPDYLILREFKPFLWFLRWSSRANFKEVFGYVLMSHSAIMLFLET